MLQQSFHNWSSEPKMYTDMMHNIHTSGHGYFGMSIMSNYLGWKMYSTGEGFIYKDNIDWNRNLIFKI